MHIKNAKIQLIHKLTTPSGVYSAASPSQSGLINAEIVNHINHINFGEQN